MVDTLLHWLCQGTTYSIKPMTADTGLLIITTPDGKTWRGRRPVPLSLINAWKRLPIAERCRHAECEIERREKTRPA